MAVAALLGSATACGGADTPAARPATQLTVSTTAPSSTTPGPSATSGATASTTTPAPATTPAPSTAGPAIGATGRLAGRVVTIDPGHNGGNGAHPREINALVDAGNRRKECDTTGTATDGGYPEAAFTWDLAQRVQQLLQAEGARVVLTRTDNTGWGPCINQRAAIGNLNRSDAAVSLHADGGPAGGRGFHVILPSPVAGLNDAIVAPSERLGRQLAAAYAAGTGMPPATYVGRDGLDRRDDLGGLNLSTVPKVFIEAGNMRNATDAALLSDPGFRQRAALALTEGITRYLRTP